MRNINKFYDNIIINMIVLYNKVIILLYIWVTSAVICSAYEIKYKNYILFENARTKAMGGACVAVANDYQAFFSNPAIFAENNEKKISLANFVIEADQNYNEFKSALEEFSENDTSQSRLSNNNLLLKLMGENSSYNGSFLAYYLAGENGLGFAVLHQYKAYVNIIRPTSPKLISNIIQDTLLISTLSRPFYSSAHRVWFRHKVKGWWGVSMKVLARSYSNNIFIARDFAKINLDMIKSNEYRGTNADFDLATLWKIEDDYNTSIGFCVNNILESNIDKNIGKLKRDASIGISMQPLQGSKERKQKLTLACDVHNLLSNYNTYLGKLRLGVETKLNDFCYLRAGIRGGYPSAGLNLSYYDLKLDLSTYSEELGSRPGIFEDRRYIANFNFNFW